MARNLSTKTQRLIRALSQDALTRNKWSDAAREASAKKRKERAKAGIKGAGLGALAYGTLAGALLLGTRSGRTSAVSMLKDFTKLRRAAGSAVSKSSRMRAANAVRKAVGRPVKGELMPKQLMIGNKWSEAARKKSAESRKRKAMSSTKKGALIKSWQTLPI
jgi:hypothetical protein